jgi:hypothetical protein
MNQLLFQHVKNLKASLLSLPATGERGFEGLIGATLYEISGVPFRLAGSGSQFGVDGKPTYEGDAICFEGKRYSGAVDRDKVISKIAEVSLTDTEIWVLGATSQIKSQLADTIQEIGLNNGVFVLILDWSATDLPPFAVALAMGGTRVQEFLKHNIRNKKTLRTALEALEAVRASQDFTPHADRIRAQCSEPTVGWALAQKANIDWMTDAFSSRKQAKTKLGQPLSPGDTRMAVRQRKTLTEKLYPYLTTISDEMIVSILGGEGNGKSWIVAQSWLALAHKPLMVFMSPDDFDETAGRNDFRDLLISKLIKQTGDRVTATTRERWHRRLRQWRSRPAKDSPRLIVAIDGINQRPKTDWARIIESFGDELKQFNGLLIITARTQYFQDCVKGRLSVRFVEISVPEWTEAERDEILTGHGIKPSDMYPAVGTVLRNPRLLGIAFELLNKADVTNFEELSVSRLLFEHMRVSERDAPVPQPAREFARKLQKHAQAIISRVKAEQQDDLNVFEDDMGAVADGRFFQTVDNDPTRYSLKDDGLSLALGFAVIDRLRTAKRNGHNLDGELDAILEPITALDDTANVILSALTVTVADAPYEQDIAASLTKGFSALQNPDQSKFPAFVGLTKTRPQGFMDAAHVLSLEGGHQPNFDWIENALIEAGSDNRAWQEIACRVHSWLSAHSLSPERNTFSHLARDPEGKVREERDKNRKKIEEKLRSLSAHERSILDNLPKVEGDLSTLSRLALLLLAGKPLALFARSLLNWCFSFALNSDHSAPYKDFIHLVSLNRIDWSHTREALLKVSAPLRATDISTTGKWTLVNILRATGHSGDGKEAQSLVDGLTKGWPVFESWRLIDQYCAADPCDPASEEPENVTRTAELYTAIDVGKLRQRMGQTSEDHFFVMARPSIARFKPEVAVAKHREFATDVLNRVGFPLRQGLLELRQHNALLTIKEARELVKKRHEAKAAGTAGSLSEQDVWIVSQYRLLLAFPFLSAREQAEILLSDETDEGILLDLLKVTKPLGEKEFETLLGSACAENSERKKYLLLALAKSTSVQLSTDACTHVAALFRSESGRARAEALGVIAQSGDEGLLRQVTESHWKAMDTETENSSEAWYGSVALLKAAAKGLIAHHEVLKRISARLYGRAATMLDIDAVRAIARRINASINQAAWLKNDLVAPDIEIQANSLTSNEPSMFRVSERSSASKDIKEAMKRMSESNEAFEQRQKRSYDAFLEFRANLTQAKASIILDHLSLKEFATVVASDEELADHWYGLFMGIAETKLPFVHNIILLLAHAFAKKAPDKAEKLFLLVKDSKPLVRFTFGKAGVQLDAMATWTGGRSPVLDNLRFGRIDRVGTDHDLSLEVLAALLNGQQELLTSYIEAKLLKEEPAEVSRGIMVAGFSDQSKINEEILKRYEGTAGLVGSAQKAAKYAYDRNVWARQWFEKMCQTDENTEFWRYAVLFSKIVDGRFAVWNSNYTRKGISIKLLGSTVYGRLENRFARWEDHRKKKLFGSDAPSPIFLEVTDGKG